MRRITIANIRPNKPLKFTDRKISLEFRPPEIAMSTVTSTPAANAYTSSQYNYLNGTYFPTPFHLQQQPLQPYIGPSPPPIAAPVVPAAASGVYSLPPYQQVSISTNFL